MRYNKLKFVTMVNPKSGDYFIKKLLEYKLLPELVVTTDPFYIKEGKNIIKYLKILKRKILYLLKKSEYREKYYPYFLAKEKGISTWPSQLVNTKQFKRKLEQLNLEYIFVFTFKILKEFIFNIPKYGTINFHPALLPKHRGVSPDFWTVLFQEKETGITFHFIDKNIDTGSIIEQHKIPLSGFEDSKLLTHILNYIGTELFIRLIIKLTHGYKIISIKQNNHKASYEKPQKKYDKLINEANTFSEIERIIKASTNYGYADFIYNNKEYKIIGCFDLTHEVVNNFEIISMDTSNNFYLKTRDNKIAYLITKSV